MNIDTTLDLLSSPVRRGVVVVLCEADSVSRDRLIAALTSDEESRRQTRIALHHNHLPRLADADLITYDDETVTATGRLERVARQFDVLEREEPNPVPN